MPQQKLSIEKLRELVDKGWTDKEIAEEYFPDSSRAEQTIRRRRWKNGIKKYEGFSKDVLEILYNHDGYITVAEILERYFGAPAGTQTYKKRYRTVSCAISQFVKRGFADKRPHEPPKYRDRLQTEYGITEEGEEYVESEAFNEYDCINYNRVDFVEQGKKGKKYGSKGGE